jgi:hypothetical protein
VAHRSRARFGLRRCRAASDGPIFGCGIAVCLIHDLSGTIHTHRTHGNAKHDCPFDTAPHHPIPHTHTHTRTHLSSVSYLDTALLHAYCLTDSLSSALRLFACLPVCVQRVDAVQWLVLGRGPPDSLHAYRGFPFTEALNRLTATASGSTASDADALVSQLSSLMGEYDRVHVRAAVSAKRQSDRPYGDAKMATPLLDPHSGLPWRRRDTDRSRQHNAQHLPPHLFIVSYDKWVRHCTAQYGGCLWGNWW